MGGWQSKSQFAIENSRTFKGLGSLDAQVEQKWFRSCSGTVGAVWGERVVMGQDDKETRACRAQEFHAHEDAGAWRRGGAWGDAGRDRSRWFYHSGSGGRQAV